LRVITPLDAFVATLRVPGAHNARNAIAACAMAFALEVPWQAMQAGLERFTGAEGRLQRRRTAGGAAVIDDTYNANPDSAKAAIDVLAAQPGRRVLAFGDMRELGEKAPALHREIGGYAKARGVHALYAMGENAPALCEGFGAGARAFDSAEALAAALAPTLDEGTVVLVKGSRGMRMERVVAALGAPVANAH
jgi:UDP-N-acetylmuramoyl-tripeptide--D-alanyl-D-alanine ligase